jgi:hypothetical protein
MGTHAVIQLRTTSIQKRKSRTTFTWKLRHNGSRHLRQHQRQTKATYIALRGCRIIKQDPIGTMTMTTRIDMRTVKHKFRVTAATGAGKQSTERGTARTDHLPCSSEHGVRVNNEPLLDTDVNLLGINSTFGRASVLHRCYFLFLRRLIHPRQNNMLCSAFLGTTRTLTHATRSN